MTERPVEYVRTTITVPRPLKRRMRRVRTINWSAVACKAFEAELANLSQRPNLSQRQGEQDMSDVPSKNEAIERLRRLKNLPEQAQQESDFQEGFQWGRRWAMATATPLELARLEGLRQPAEQHWLPPDDRGGKKLMKRIALVVTGADAHRQSASRPGPIPSVAREFWPVKVGLPEKPRDCRNFAQGFCEGALQFWREVKDQI